MRRSILLTLLLAIVGTTASALAQDGAAQPVTIAIFPFRNVTGEVKYDELGWTFIDSLENYLNATAGAGTSFKLIPVDDIRDQMLAQNIDVKSPSYEGDVWMVAEALGASKIIWGSYVVKYEKANLEVKVIDAKTLMPDPAAVADRLRPLYPEALTTVATVGDKILPGLHQ
jgi:hypothetical protein